jgi:AraC family transcriptional regulator
MPEIDPAWRTRTCDLYLEEPPTLARVGQGVHGVTSLVDRYRLPTFWCLHLYRYRAMLRIGDYWFPIRPGFASIIPAGVPQEYQYEGRSPHLYSHFQCPTPPLLRAAPSTPVPFVQDLGDRFPALYESFEEMVRLSPRLPGYRLRARLWDLLGQLADAPSPIPAASPAVETTPAPELHPAVRFAVQQIELRLGEEMSVPALSRGAGVSERYLTYLFRAHLGETVVGYLRQRRVERALHLLRHSTLPVKSIAIAVGIPDLHLFNKTIRAVTGQSPRSVRTNDSVNNSTLGEGEVQEILQDA